MHALEKVPADRFAHRRLMLADAGREDDAVKTAKRGKLQHTGSIGRPGPWYRGGPWACTCEPTLDQIHADDRASTLGTRGTSGRTVQRRRWRRRAPDRGGENRGDSRGEATPLLRGAEGEARAVQPAADGAAVHGVDVEKFNRRGPGVHGSWHTAMRIRGPRETAGCVGARTGCGAN